MYSDPDFYNTKQLEFVGEMSYLNDIMYPPYEFSGDIPAFFNDVLEYYNSKCSANRKIYAGTITVSDPNNYISRSNEEYSSCWSILKEKLVDLCGGYLVLRYAGDSRYLDYLLEPGTHNSQPIEFGKNLLDIERYIDASNLATVIIPQGAQLDDDSETKARLDIKSVNDGKEYIETSFVDVYGRIEAVVQWDDVVKAKNLKQKAEEYAKTMVLKDMTITTKVVDLHLTDRSIMKFNVGDTIDCQSKPHDIEATFLLTERERNLNDPASDTITIGNKEETLTSQLNNVIRQASDTDQKVVGNFLQRVIEEQTKLLLAGGNGYIQFGYAEDGHVSEIFAMDSDNTATAKEVIRINQNGIGFSHTGINGPYESAWTIDGKFNADFITAGTIMANLIKGGTLKLGGKDNGYGVLKIINAKGEEIGTWDKDGITVEAMISGDLETWATELGYSSIRFYKDGEVAAYLTLSDISNNKKMLRIASDGPAVLCSPELCVVQEYLEDWNDSSTTAKMLQGTTGSTKVCYKTEETSSGVTYYFRTLKFVNGILVSSLE
jgi:hypothetical protein